MAKNESIWAAEGKDKTYEHYRLSDSESSKVLRSWVDDAYFGKNLKEFLDSDFIIKFRNEDFFARLWELELVEALFDAGLRLIPTKGAGPDFHVVLSDGRSVWVEAVLSRPNPELEKIYKDAMGTNSHTFDTPRELVGLRYRSNLGLKADIIRDNYQSIIGENDFAIIATSGIAMNMIQSDIEDFMPAILPIDRPLVHFSTNRQPLDDSPRPTHEVRQAYLKKSGNTVSKELLYPGDQFAHVDGVIFSQASNLQGLLGVVDLMGKFNDSTNRLHIFENYSSKGTLPKEFTGAFYYHKFRDNGKMVSLDQLDPKGVTVAEGEVQHG